MARPPILCLASMEVDIYPKHKYQAVRLLVAKLGNRSAFAKRSGYFVDCVSPDLATLPNGWAERLVPFRTKRTGGVTGWCLEIHDLALSKLAAGRVKDLEYIHALLQAKLIRPGTLKDRIEDTFIPSGEKQTLGLRLKELSKKKPSARRHTRKQK